MSRDLCAIFAKVHDHATGEILHLLDGFFSNLEFGLFELASHLNGKDVQSRCFDLMREMRLQRPKLLERFTRLVEADQELWMDGDRHAGEVKNESLYCQAQSLAHKRSAHFSPVIQLIAQRTAYATNRDPDQILLPISPLRISYNFLRSCQLPDSDESLAAMVHNLFGRLVLDRLGTIYGACNESLEKSGYPDGAESMHRAEIPPDSGPDQAGA